MKKILITFVAVIIVAFFIIILGARNNTYIVAEYSNDYTRTFGEFTAKTASALLREKKENTCYSPASLFGNLTLSAEITEGNTQEELIKFLGVNDITSLEEYYTKLLGNIDVNSVDSKILLSNALWTQKDRITEVASNKLEKIKEKLDCEIYVEDSIDELEVNQWMSENTNGLIKDVEIGNGKNFALVNTLYYKSKWKTDVGKKKEEQEFYTEDGQTIMVPYLSVYKKILSYKESKDYTYVIVKLEEGQMVLVLPNSKYKVENLLSENKLNEIIASITGDNKAGVVKLVMPEFRIENSISDSEMKALLENNDVHDLDKDAKWIDGIEGGDVSLMQKTLIKMDEKGVEASATTNMFADIGIFDEPKSVLDITFDRPFMYILMKDGVPLFIGTVYNPAE